MNQRLQDEQQIEDSLAQNGDRNKPERLEWFSGLGLGAFIHLSIDVQLGMVISHNLINANADYCARYFSDLPKTFDPYAFDARRWARFFRSIGISYVVLTNKHHNGFCNWHTETTPFAIQNTPFERDMTRELFEACREEGLAIGVYFSPDDFHVLWKQCIPIARRKPGVLPKDNPELMALAKDQIRELLTNYGNVDVIFFDGDPTGLKDLAWDLQPDIVVTRGALKTPKQHLPDLDDENNVAVQPWEACFTLGRQWQYRALHESYKSTQQLVEMLIRTRAGGGNLLLNFGPKADGSIAPEQESVMREVGMWMFVNREAIIDTQPYRCAKEGDIFFTQSKDGKSVYAHMTNIDWPSLADFNSPAGQTQLDEPKYDPHGLHSAKAKRLVWRLKSVRAGANTQVRLMGQATDCVSMSAIQTTLTWQQEGDELVIEAYYVHRQYNDWYWDLPMVVAIDHPE